MQWKTAVDVSPHDLEENLNALANDGWQIYGIHTTYSGSYGVTEFVIIAYRE